MTTQHIKDFLSAAENIKNITVVEDSTVDRGGCVIETDFGAIDAKIASQLLGLLEDDFGPDYIENRNKMIEAITLEDAKRVSKRLFSPENLIVTIVGQPVTATADKKG